MIILHKFILTVKMAFRNILRQKKRSLIVASTAAVGLFCVTLSQGFINGFLNNMLFMAIESGLGHVQIRPSEYIDTRQPGLRLKNSRAVGDSLHKGLPPELKFAGRVEADALLRIGGDVQGVLLLGVDPAREDDVSNMPEWIYQGTFFKEPERRLTGAKESPRDHSCLLGRKSAREHELGIGDWIVLTTGRENTNSISFRCNITGLFHASSDFIDQSMVLMRRSDLSRLRYGNPDETGYFVFLGKDYRKADAMKRTILSLVKKGPEFGVYTFRELEPFINSYFEITNQFTWILYTIILMGFGIVLFESVTMSIFERQHEIGIINALGAPSSFLFWLVMLEAFLLTLGGALLSLIPGLALMGVLSYTGVNFEGFTLSDLSWGGGLGVVYPFVTVGDILMGIVIATFVGFFSGIYPAFKAVRLSPVKAIYGH